MTSAPDTCRTIGWNGIVLNCPQHLEVFVSEEKHLVFEQDFLPVFELRWHTNKKNKQEKILRNLQQETNLLLLDSVPPVWQKLTSSYALNMLAEKGHKTYKAALLTCKVCGTSLLFFFFKNPEENALIVHKLLSSLQCHDERKADKLWAIQDFRCLLPSTFTLSSYSFAAGLSRLSFADSELTMHLCRIAPAAQRLETASLAELMLLLGDTAAAEAEIIHRDQSVLYSRQPTIFSQIMIRLKRKLPFQWMILRHHQKEDRLSGLFFESKKPLPQKMIQTILESYEIIPL